MADGMPTRMEKVFYGGFRFWSLVGECLPTMAGLTGYAAPAEIPPVLEAHVWYAPWSEW